MSRCVYILMLLLFFGLGFVKAEDSVVSDGLQYSELIEQNEFYENVRIGTTFFELLDILFTSKNFTVSYS